MRSKTLQKADPALIEANLGLVHDTVSKRCAHYAHGLVDYDDLIGWGTLGLIVALQRFDPSKGFRFSTFAVWYIRGYVLSGIRSTYSELWKANERGEDTTPYRLPPERLFPGATDPRRDIETQHNRMAARKILRRAWPHLTKAQKEIWRLHIGEGLTFSEIARRKGASRQGVHNTWKYSILRVRERLARKAA